jgi:hypothetical protein
MHLPFSPVKVQQAKYPNVFMFFGMVLEAIIRNLFSTCGF